MSLAEPFIWSAQVSPIILRVAASLSKGRRDTAACPGRKMRRRYSGNHGDALPERVRCNFQLHRKCGMSRRHLQMAARRWSGLRSR